MPVRGLFVRVRQRKHIHLAEVAAADLEPDRQTCACEAAGYGDAGYAIHIKRDVVVASATTSRSREKSRRGFHCGRHEKVNFREDLSNFTSDQVQITPRLSVFGSVRVGCSLKLRSGPRLVFFGSRGDPRLVIRIGFRSPQRGSISRRRELIHFNGCAGCQPGKERDCPLDGFRNLRVQVVEKRPADNTKPEFSGRGFQGSRVVGYRGVDGSRLERIVARDDVHHDRGILHGLTHWANVIQGPGKCHDAACADQSVGRLEPDDAAVG